jgi:prolipoprotein diacylglyceryltransferase
MSTLIRCACACNRWLDRTVARAQEVTASVRSGPHATLWGAALLGLPLAGAAIAAVIAERWWVPPLVVVLDLVAYHRLYMPLKRWLRPGARRKFLLDYAFFCAPFFFAVTASLGERVAAMADFAALLTPLALVVLRAGCFLGGCCHGVRAAFGVRYPGRDERVLPLPLFEAVFAAGLWIFGLVDLARHGATGQLLPLVLLPYCSYRFGAEFLRAKVPRIAGLTATQWLAASVVVALVAWR